MLVETIFMALFFGTMIWLIIVRPTPDDPDFFDEYKNCRRKRKRDKDNP